MRAFLGLFSKSYFVFCNKKRERKKIQSDSKYDVISVQADQRHKFWCKNGGKTAHHTYMYLPCFYRAMETRVNICENEKCCGNTKHRDQKKENNLLTLIIKFALLTPSLRHYITTSCVSIELYKHDF